MSLNEWWYENMYKWCHESRRNYTFVNLKAMKILKWCIFVLVTQPWWLPEEWPEACSSLLVVGAGLCTVLALTQLGIRQTDWWRAGIRSTNLHIVVEFVIITIGWGKIHAFQTQVSVWNWSLPGKPPEALTGEIDCFPWSVLASGPPIHLCW